MRSSPRSAGFPSIDVTKTFIFPPVSVPRHNPYVRALRDAVRRSTPDKEVLSVGRDGASDAVAFMDAGIPAVEFGPDGAGHHGPDEWVSVSSLARYRRSLVGFVRTLPMWLERPVADEGRDDDSWRGTGSCGNTSSSRTIPAAG